MKLTHTGYNLVVAIWLAPIVLFDFIANTIYTGRESQIYYFKCMLDAVLLLYALYTAYSADTASVASARARTAAKDDSVVSFENVGAWEYIYCGLLVLYAGGNWYSLFQMNSNSTGIISVAALIWSILSLVVGFLSMVQFYHLKSGAIVQLQHKVMN